ncbi:hypothetical protein TBCH5v1_2088 [Thermococcus barophilus]|uniref:Uncharacterized protein n=1 Tax=Thermococcus barophilus TaxID=55802 RepID=A0A0S1XDX0_THEBA|nr:hypothetical protein TBCH5v1_2088 [Thermococcus barophilus]
MTKERLLYTHDIVRSITTKKKDIRDLFFVNQDLWRYLEPYVSKYFEEVMLFVGELIDPLHLKTVKVATSEFREKVIQL